MPPKRAAAAQPAQDPQEAEVQQHYNSLYTQLAQQAQHKYFSGQSLSGKGTRRIAALETLFERTEDVDGIKFLVATEEPLQRFVKTQQLPASLSEDAEDAVSRGEQRTRLLGMNAWERHKRFMADYMQFYSGQLPEDTNRTVKTDLDVLRENYRFIREETDDVAGGWEVKLARRYYSKLFREYCIADLSHYKVNFAYEEAGEQKAALVKLRLCPKHALQLNFQKTQAALQKQKEQRRKAEKRAKRRKSKEGERSPKRRRRSPAGLGDDSDGDAEPGSSSARAEKHHEDSQTRSGAELADEQPSAAAAGAGAAASGQRPGSGSRSSRREAASGVEADADAFFAGLFE